MLGGWGISERISFGLTRKLGLSRCIGCIDVGAWVVHDILVWGGPCIGGGAWVSTFSLIKKES